MNGDIIPDTPNNNRRVLSPSSRLEETLEPIAPQQLNNFMRSGNSFARQAQSTPNRTQSPAPTQTRPSRSRRKQAVKEDVKNLKKMLVENFYRSKEYRELQQNESIRSIIHFNLSDQQLDMLPADRLVQMVDNQRNLVKILAGKEREQRQQQSMSSNIFNGQQHQLQAASRTLSQPRGHQMMSIEMPQYGIEEEKQSNLTRGNDDSEFQEFGIQKDSEGSQQSPLEGTVSPNFAPVQKKVKIEAKVKIKTKLNNIDTSIKLHPLNTVEPAQQINIDSFKNVGLKSQEIHSSIAKKRPDQQKLQIDISSIYTPGKRQSQAGLTSKSISEQKSPPTKITPPSNPLAALMKQNKVGVQFGIQPPSTPTEAGSPAKPPQTIGDLQSMVKSKMKEAVSSQMKKGPKEKKKKICIDCGGYKPPEASPRTKAKERAMKQKLKQMELKKKLKSANNESNKKLQEFVGSLPAPLQLILSVCCGIEKEKKKADDKPVSFKILKKHIAQNHPVDPLTQEKFSIHESPTVYNYGLKMTDACFCMAIYNFFRRAKKRLLNWCFKKQKKLIEKPESMKDVPDSGSDSENHDSFEGLSQAAIYVGEGAILYLQIVKTLGIMCVILSIINFPLYIVYANAANLAPVNIFKMSDVIDGYCMGNIGSVRQVCQNNHIPWDAGPQKYPYLPQIKVDLQSLKKGPPKVMNFRCPLLDDYFFEVAHFGFTQKIDYEYDSFTSAQQRCQNVNDLLLDIQQQEQDSLEYTYTISDEDRAESNDIREFYNALLNPDMIPEPTKYNMDKQCNYETMFKSEEAKDEFRLYFKQKCYLKNSCSIDIENMQTNMTYTEKKWNENNFEEPYNPLYPYRMKENKLTNLISEDCYKRIFQLEVAQTEFIAILSCQKDVMRFFMVPSGQIHKEELGFIAVICDILSICVMYYMFGKLKVMNEEYLRILDNNVIRMKDFSIQVRRYQFDNTTQDLRILKLKLWLHFEDLLAEFRTDQNQMEIADIQFSLSKQERHKAIYKITELKGIVDEINRKKANGEYSPGELWAKSKELTKCQERIEKLEIKYKEAVKQEFKNALTVSTAPKWQLYDMVEYIYISFKSNQTPKKVKELFVVEPTSSKIVRRIFCIDDAVKDNIELADQQLEVLPTVDPDQILWNNIGYSVKDQQFRSVVSVIVQVLTMVFSVVVTLEVANLQSQVDVAKNCPEEEITPEKAYNEQTIYTLIEIVKAKKENPALSAEQIMAIKKNFILAETMSCYCAAVTKGGLAIWTIFSPEWKQLDVDGLDDNNYCAGWYKKFLYATFINNLSEFTVIILNSMIAVALQYLSEFLKRHTTISEQTTGFQQIFSQEYFNMGCILLLISFDPSGVSQTISGQEIPIIYDGFSYEWYQAVGKNLCTAIFASAIASNISEIKKLITSSFNRFKDRGFKPNLKKDLEDEDDDEPNTKIKIQKDLNALYTGGSFEGASTFSRIMSTLLVLLSYSSGMPVLYIIGAVFFLFTYQVNKIVLYKLYQKSLDLNRVVPQYSMDFLNFTLFLHVIIGGFMITNPDLFTTHSKTGVGFAMPALPVNPGDELRKSAGVVSSNKDIEDSEFKELEGDPLTKIINKVSERMKFFHQQVYMMFVIGLIASFVSGKFLRRILLFIWDQIMNLLRTAWNIIYSMISKTFRMIKRLLLECFQKIRDAIKPPPPPPIQTKKLLRNISSIEQGRIKCESEHSSISDESMNDDKVAIPKQAQEMIEKMQNDIQAEADLAEKQRKEKLLLRFRMQIEKPYWSDNIYLELNIENLTQCYIRAKQDLKDLKKFFSITDQNEEEVFTDTGKSRLKSDIRIQFEEKCYLTKLTYDEVARYLEILRKRQVDIEEVISAHYNTVKKAILKEKQDKMYRQMRKDEEEQSKLTGKTKGSQTTRTARSQKAATNRSGSNKASHQEETKKEKEDREKEEAIQKIVIRDQLAADPELQFDNPFICTPMKKLAQLYEFEETLLNIDKNKKENRRGLQTICRMQGSLSQSYYLWDSQHFKAARDIFYELENREEEVLDDNNDELEEIYAHMQFKQKNEAMRMQKDLERDNVNKQ